VRFARASRRSWRRRRHTLRRTGRCQHAEAAEIELGPRHRVSPFLAYPLVGAVAYTFGGLATDTRARVLRDGAPIPGLYAAGEITGHFHATAPNAVSVLRALVFGRIAGCQVVADFAAG
jgi:succinate dehydrogenase/fumarate reductase flavoprotein subunit